MLHDPHGHGFSLALNRTEKIPLFKWIKYIHTLHHKNLLGYSGESWTTALTQWDPNRQED